MATITILRVTYDELYDDAEMFRWMRDHPDHLVERASLYPKPGYEYVVAQDIGNGETVPVAACCGTYEAAVRAAMELDK